jgi:hypothetical protein
MAIAADHSRCRGREPLTAMRTTQDADFVPISVVLDCHLYSLADLPPQTHEETAD